MLSIATGVVAQNLRELRDRLQTIHPSSIYYHFWGSHLRAGFDEPEYKNDFAVWAHEGLHDDRLAERLSVIDPSDFRDLDALREDLIDVVEERLDESEHVPWAKADQAFRFIRSIIVVFDTGIRVNHPKKFSQVLPQMSAGSLYYHFIDARRRPPEGIDDFRAWLAGFGDQYGDLRDQIAEIDPYFITLAGLRRQLTTYFREHAG